MSAYGKITRPASTVKLPVRSYVLPNDSVLTVFPARRETIPREALEFLASVFNEVIEEGRTYPQLDQMTVDEFADYFFAQDCFVGLLDDRPPNGVVAAAKASAEGGVNREDDVDISDLRGSRAWTEAVLGMFYVKPNYPGRSSHNCNGGFVVPTTHRGLKVGYNMGKAYLYYAPRLGYRGSVFNLVYVSNTASLRIWDALGFERAGLIPNAGRLKSKTPGGEDEYTDAVVYFKNLTAGSA